MPARTTTTIDLREPEIVDIPTDDRAESLLEADGDDNKPTRPSFTISEVPSESPVMTSPPPNFLSLDEDRRPGREQTLDPRTQPDVIPPTHSRRTLVLCFDGTRDQFDADNSNIVELFSLLKKDDKNKQMVYYQAGLGTYVSPQRVTPMMTKISKAMDTLVAWNLEAHVMDGYEFLMQTYTAGDRICLFGFSRGAYTARSLAGMLHKVGLLPADNWQQVPFAYKMYTRTDRFGWEESRAFKKAFSIDVEIEFVGCWDTVSSVGLIPRRLPFTVSNTLVHTFRHALSLDERRAKFKANLWHAPDPRRPSLGPNGTYLSAPWESDVPEDEQRQRELEFERWLPRKIDELSRSLSRSRERNEKESKDGDRRNTDESTLSKMEKRFSVRRKKPTDVEEVWFVGCHCDVGGGSVSNTTRHSLARISLRWMVRECFKTNSGIMFEAERLREIGMDPATLWPFVTPRPPPKEKEAGTLTVEQMPKTESESFLTQGLQKSMKKGGHVLRRVTRRLSRRRGDQLDESAESHASSSEKSPTSASFRPSRSPPMSEEDEELRDALSPTYDQLDIWPAWWLLEVVPMEFRGQGRSGQDRWFGPNLARPRVIPGQHKHGLRVHRSVRLRMEAMPPDLPLPGGRAKKGKRWKSEKYRPRAEFTVDPTWVD